MRSLLAGALIVAVTQAGVSVVDQFQAADRYGKMTIIADTVLGRRSATEDETRRLLLVAMKDPDASVRAQAVGSVATVLITSSWTTIPPGQEWMAKLRPVAATLQGAIESATTDPEPRVRTEALRGIVGPYSFSFGAQLPPMPRSIAERLATVFNTDASTQVRTLALQATRAAHTSSDPEVRRIARDMLLRALADSDQYVVQSAGLLAADVRPRLPEALPLLVKQLKNPSHIARMGVAQGIAAYGSDAKGYLPDLQAALAAETDDITRRTIAGTISLVSR